MKRIILDNQKINDQKRNFSNLSVQAINKRFKKSLEYYSQQKIQLPKVLNGKYILLGDGIWYKFDGQDWVEYIFLLKPRRRNYAYLLEPSILKGMESFNNWKIAIDKAVPTCLKDHIFAFVSDNFKASGKITKHFGWKHQLCHFHLIKELQRRRCLRKLNDSTRSIRIAIYLIIRRLLIIKSDKEADPLKILLLQLAGQPNCPKKMSMIARQFLKDIDKYRTYRLFLEYTIPNTNNACESLNSLIRRRTVKLNNPNSVGQWIKAFIRLKRTIKCNGKY